MILALALATLPQQMLSTWVISSLAGADARSKESGADPTPAVAEPLAPSLTPIAAALQSYGKSLCSAVKPLHTAALQALENPATRNGPLRVTGFDWLNLFLGTAGWLVGLYASGFPDLLRRKASPGFAQPTDAVSP